MKIAIQNGRIIDPLHGFDKIGDLAIDAGKIVQIGTLPEGFQADKIINAQDQWVLPGLVDICCRPQISHQGSTFTEASAALKRGITSLLIPPDSDPILDTPANVLRLLQQTEPLPHLYPIGALTSLLAGDFIADLTALAQAGCIAFSNAQKPIQDLQILRHCYDFAASFDLLVIIQPQDYYLSQGGVAHEGLVATRLGLPGIPDTAETLSIAQHLLLIEQTDLRAHFTCLSSEKAVKLIAAAKSQGLKVTADTAMHSLHLTEMDLLNFNANCHLYPPLRSERDRAALLQGIKDGTIDAICSDHRPLEAMAKLAPFGDTTPGLSAIDTYLSLGLSLVKQEQISLMNLIAAMTSHPAQRFQLPASADLIIIDPNRYWKVTDKNLFSKGKNTPFNGWELPGIVTHTLLNGKCVYEDAVG